MSLQPLENRHPTSQTGDTDARNHSSMQSQRTVRWASQDGTAVSCEEKLKVLNENLAEIRQSCQDALQPGRAAFSERKAIVRESGTAGW